jgi:hypothetical protein
MTMLPELHPDTAKTLVSIRDTHAEIKKLPPDYDYPMPALISHVDDYSGDLPRLRRYAGQVISARIMQFGFTTLYKTFYLLDMFLRGYVDRNIFEMLFASRALIEIYAVTADTYTIIAKNAGDEAERFVERIKEIDEALITATYGTRSDRAKQSFEEVGSSKLREIADKDVALIQAKNILTRIDRVSKMEEYPDCRSDYDRLSEYVHPNIGQNVILGWPSPKNPDWARLSRRSQYAFITATNACAVPTAKASRYIVSHILDSSPPFAGETVYPNHSGGKPPVRSAKL